MTPVEPEVVAAVVAGQDVAAQLPGADVGAPPSLARMAMPLMQIALILLIREL